MKKNVAKANLITSLNTYGVRGITLVQLFNGTTMVQLENSLTGQKNK